MTPNSRADELVKSFPPTAENYDKVILSLKNCFGRDDLQIEVYVRELLQLVLKNAVTPAKDVVLSRLYDKIESHLRSLESLGVTTDKCAAMLFPLVESSLPEELLRAWQRSSVHDSSSRNNNDVAVQSNNKLTQLIKFLEEEVQNELRITMAMEGFNLRTKQDTESYRPKREKTRETKEVPSATGLLTTKTKNKPCLFCNNGGHESANCEQAKRLTLRERQDIVKGKRACFNCLNIGHGYKNCHVKLKCAWCSRRHVILMCPDVGKGDSEAEPTETVKNECSLASYCRDPEVLLQTMRVKLYNGRKEIFVRAIIDTGSQKSYITEEAAARVGYKSIAEILMTHSLFGGKKSGTASHKKYIVHLSSLDKITVAIFLY